MVNNVDILEKMKDSRNWKTVRQKNTYTLYMCVPPLGTRIVNTIDDKEYIVNKGDVVLSGTRQELWVTKLNLIIKNYVYADGTLITQDTLKKKIVNGCINWQHIKPKFFGNSLAFFIDNKHKNLVLPNGLIANKEGKKHGKGDFLVANNIVSDGIITDYTLINGEIFFDTFDMRSHPGLMTTDITSVESTPYPKYDFCPKLRKEEKKEVKTKKVEEKGKAEIDDFNLIGLRSVKELKELLVDYDIKLADVISNKSIEENYVKIDIKKNDIVYTIKLEIDKNNFVIVKGVSEASKHIKFKSFCFSDAYKTISKKIVK